MTSGVASGLDDSFSLPARFSKSLSDLRGESLIDGAELVCFDMFEIEGPGSSKRVRINDQIRSKQMAQMSE